MPLPQSARRVEIGGVENGSAFPVAARKIPLVVCRPDLALGRPGKRHQNNRARFARPETALFEELRAGMRGEPGYAEGVDAAFATERGGFREKGAANLIVICHQVVDRAVFATHMENQIAAQFAALTRG